MKTVHKLLLVVTALGLLAVLGCKQPLDLSMQRNRIFLMGRLLAGKTCDVRLIWRKAPDDSSPVTVTADLSEIGGEAEQELAETGNGTWRWTGQVTPFEKGKKKIIITSVVSQEVQTKNAKMFQVFDTDKAVGISAGDEQNLAVRADGTVESWPRGGGTSIVVEGLTDVVAVSAGFEYNLALRNNGTVAAWGSACSGVCYVPAELDDVVAIAASSNYNGAYAVKADGTVVGWKDSSFSGDPAPEGLHDVVNIACSDFSCLVLRGDGTVGAWGQDEFAVDGITDAVGVAVGNKHFLVLKSNGLVQSFGSMSIVPIRSEKYKAVDIVAGDDYGAELQRDGTLSVWLEFPSRGPYYVLKGFKNIVALSGAHTIGMLPSGLALKDDGSIISWAFRFLGFELQSIPDDLK